MQKPTQATSPPEQSTPADEHPVQIRIHNHGPKDKRYRISRMGVLVSESKTYRASDSVVKALKALKLRLAKRKVLEAPSGEWHVKVASANGSIVMESVSFESEQEAETVMADLQAFFDAGGQVEMSPGRFKRLKR